MYSRPNLKYGPRLCISTIINIANLFSYLNF